MKICSKCKIEKDEIDFCKDKYKKDGLHCQCKKCHNVKTPLTEEQIKNRKEYEKQYKKNKREDPLYVFQQSISSMIRKSFRRKNLNKKGKTNFILGCSYDEFLIYIESQFESWMTWENRGLYNGTFNYGWDIDHKIPLSTAKTQDELIKLNHFSNLQPLCSHYNRNIKKDNII